MTTPVPKPGEGKLPGWYPEWARRLGELYFSRTTSVFALTGNVFDLVALSDEPKPRYGTVAEFLAEQLFGRWELVLHYDLARGLRCLAGSDAARLRDMVALANREVHDLAELPKDPSVVLAVLDRFVQRNLLAKEGEPRSAAVILDYASYLVPRDGRDLAASRHLVTLLNWASSPYVKRLNMATVLIDGRLSDLAERFSENPHVAALEVPLPDKAQRQRYLETTLEGRDVQSFSDYGVPQIAELTAGIANTDLGTLVHSTLESGGRLDGARFSALKKRLIERQAQGLLEFVEPSYGLDMVVGQEAAKQRLRDDAELIRRGALQTVPMGYLICGPVGTGKSFLAQCTAGAIGIPLVKLKNFRSKYVGETEGNLERVLGLLRGMGPVVVLIDEADAMLGDRDQGGDSGVGSRVFGMIAAQMGDTRYRGRIVWMLLTARPDLLPIDLKRQGRAEVHIPMFYPTDQAELRDMLVTLAKKTGATLRAEDVPPIPHVGLLSGADIEGIVGRAWRRTLLSGGDRISKELLAEVLAAFMPSHQSLEKELQELAAIIECTDKEFLPAFAVQKLEKLGGRQGAQERLSAIERVLAK